MLLVRSAKEVGLDRLPSSSSLYSYTLIRAVHIQLRLVAPPKTKHRDNGSQDDGAPAGPLVWERQRDQTTPNAGDRPLPSRYSTSLPPRAGCFSHRVSSLLPVLS